MGVIIFGRSRGIGCPGSCGNAALNFTAVRPVSPAQNDSQDSAVSEAALASASRDGLCLCRRRALPLSVNPASVTGAQIDRLLYDLYCLTDVEITIVEGSLRGCMVCGFN